MTVLARVASIFDRRMSVSDLDRIMDMGLYGGMPTWSGNQVSEQGALRNAAVWSCVRVISESIAAMPCHIYRRLDSGGKEIARTHYLYSVLHDEPNPNTTSFDYRALVFAHLLTWGNHYSYIEWDNAMRVKALWPLTPDRIRVERRDDSSDVEYSFRKKNGTWLPIPAEDMFHIRGLGYDGIRGYSVIQLHRNTIGASDAVNEFGARFFANGARPSGTLNVPGTLSPTGQDNLRESFMGQYGGLKNVARVIVLEGGVTFTATNINPDDAQFLETRKFNRSEIAGIFRVPPHMIGDLEKATFSNIEQLSLEFVMYTLVPWMTRFESQAELSLLTPAGRTGYFIELDANGLLRGDAVTRTKYYNGAITGGWMTPNQAAAKENMNPVPAGDVYYRPLNTAYVDASGKVIAMTPPGSGPAKQDDSPAEGEPNAKAA